jgi:hypothetical protein
MNRPDPRQNGTDVSPDVVHAVYTEHRVLDEQGNHIGKVVDVVYDEPHSSDTGSNEPSWLVVDPGVLRAAHYVPVAGSYRTAKGDIVVPWDQHWVHDAPKAKGDHVLTPDDLDQLRAHYAATN